MYVSQKKYFLFQEKVKFLRLLAERNGILVVPSKVEVIENGPNPKSLTELRKLLSLIQFFKRFILRYSEAARPLTDSTKKGSRITKWNAECDRAFATLKEKFMTAPILISPRRDRPFQLHVDASHFATRATLTQKDADGRERVIAYASKK